MSEADAIEAAARATWRHDMNHGLSTRLDGPTVVHRAEAAAAYAAIAPIVRRDVAEEIATEIEAEGEFADGGYADGVGEVARIAREIGGRSIARLEGA